MEFIFKNRYEYLVEVAFTSVSRYIIISENTLYTIKTSTRHPNVHALYYGSGDDFTFIHSFGQDEYNRFITFIRDKEISEILE